MKTVAVIQARMGSTRLRGKVLEKIRGRPALAWIYDVAMSIKAIDKVVIATSTLDRDDEIAHWAKYRHAQCFRGSETDVLSRYMGVAQRYDADIIIRLTGDCPFVDPRVISEVIKLREIQNAAYATNTDPPTYPDGLDVEVFTRDALEFANREAVRGTDRDCVTRIIVRNRHRFRTANLVCPLPHLERERWVLDSPEDLDFLREVSKRLSYTWPGPSYLDVLQVLDREPTLRQINAKYSRNERFYADLSHEQETKRSYAMSSKALAEAETIIPGGAQTFSKSKLMFPQGAAPLFLSHGDGGYAFDIDGNDYIDCVGGLLANILGYRDPDVDLAIRTQLDRGISFSLASVLEQKLAYALKKHIPSAEMVRFGKNGSDVTTAAVRLARWITGCDPVIVHGYHGWHSWTTENGHGVTFGEKDDIERAIGADLLGNRNFVGAAAVIIEPEMFSVESLERIRFNCNRDGCLLIFDEIISGFRAHMGGLQALTGVIPDLSTFGKSMGNGMPISALVGKAQYMKRMPEIAYSGTFFGEALSLAASIATIEKLEREDVCGYLDKAQEFLTKEISELFSKHRVENISLNASSPFNLNRIKFADNEVRSLFIQEMAKNGVLIIASHNLCFAHKKPQLEKIVSAWDATLHAITHGAKLEGGIIEGKPIR